MDIEQVKAAKKELEENIKKLLRGFEQKTGIEVEDVFLARSPAWPTEKMGPLVAVMVTVRMR